jgi:hypothetical protein
MLKKLLKYDFKSVLRYWWIAAVSSLVFSVIGSGCISLLNSEREIPPVATMFAGFTLILVFVSYSAFILISMLFIFIRFYKNFFTDEGYLTFTLPVKRMQLLNSKLIVSTITVIATYVVCAVNIVAMLCVGFAKDVFTKEFWNSLVEFCKIAIDDIGVYLWIYIFELLLILILSVVFSCLFLFSCITFASIITKRAKVITAIGIYYGANSIFSFAMEIFYLFAIPSIYNWGLNLGDTVGSIVIALILLGVIFMFSIFCMLLYTLQYWMIDRKLNLS